MEVNLKDNRIHFEFYGLPGCGKSTVSRIVAKSLRDYGNPVDEPSYNIGIEKNPLLRRILKIYNLFSYMLIQPRKTAEVLKIVKNNKYIGMAGMKQIINIIQKLKIYDENRPSILIWDEGLVQAAVSLSLNGHVDSSDNERRLFQLASRDKVVKIYLFTSVKVAEERINKRGKGHSRIEIEQNIQRRQELLQRFFQCCENIDPFYKIDVSENTPEDIAKAIIALVQT